MEVHVSSVSILKGLHNDWLQFGSSKKVMGTPYLRRIFTDLSIFYRYTAAGGICDSEMDHHTHRAVEVILPQQLQRFLHIPGFV